MKICYIDESGGFETEGSTTDATPLMVLVGLIVDHTCLRQLTRDYLLALRQPSARGPTMSFMWERCGKTRLDSLRGLSL